MNGSGQLPVVAEVAVRFFPTLAAPVFYAVIFVCQKIKFQSLHSKLQYI